MKTTLSDVIDAVARLALFRAGELRLDQTAFDNNFDTVLDFLESTNNEKYRVSPELK